MSTKIEQINTFMLEEFSKANVPDTPGTRLAFLEGLWDTWMAEDDSELPLPQLISKMGYILEVKLELTRLRSLL